jgi:hypothetical protein
MPTKSLGYQDLERHRDRQRLEVAERMNHIRDRDRGFEVVARSWSQLTG